MKKKYIQIIAFSLALMIGNTGCKDFLNELPDSRVSPQSVEDYQAMIVPAYPQANYVFTELMTDNLKYYDYPSFNQPTLVSWLKPFYTWSDGYDLNLPIGPEKSWQSYYNNINVANVAIEGLNNITKDSPLKRSVLGEAYLVRAYCHFMLVNLFAKHYDPATASTDLGVPYKQEVGNAQQEDFPRETVAKVYEYIESDLQSGIELINDDLISTSTSVEGNTKKYHFSKAAAYAFLSRVKLYKGEWEACIEASDKALVLNSSVRDLVTDYNNFLPGKNDFVGFRYDYASNAKSNILLMSQTVEYNSYNSSGFYANEFKELFLPDDYRGKIYAFTTNTTPNWGVLKFIGAGQRASTIIEFSVEEVLLNQAEAYVKAKAPNYNAAIANINKILAKRYSPFTALTATEMSKAGDLKKVLSDRIITERRLEFAYEGLRWFDIKRLKLSVEHTTQIGTETLQSDDLRYAIQIPFMELAVNKAMVKNPR
ncbi:RagB/SusD family nutrient uptake outer membrane protein [Solitalea canadensis]|uniref:RagB/SusD family protein n=1 Tax=Solitalea canadensis (strain ATCC 29591 / DSM 3403 / JCM 21819 / LMG 8368 / NBRC 15130 / NCIMB 12057 / USAM 9D) TaxID=929556 RepID=H8KUW0_SOLCM|nr:RagB/SusD family nutrient uptake outer membrane protein [Solitalea canadensis]AFD07660.1 RagB/SusD family protein [Solitalea canadensis DSM 3403]